MTLKEIADQLEFCGYVCEAGKLEMNEAFIALRKYAQQEPYNEAANCETDIEEYVEMTIEEAIKHCEEVSRRSPCTPCERDHMQLAGWLSELVSLRARQEQLNEPLTGPLKIGDFVHGMKITGLDALAGTITLSGWESFYCKLEQEEKEQIHDSD